MGNSGFTELSFCLPVRFTASLALWALLSIFLLLSFRKFFRCELLVGSPRDFSVLRRICFYFSSVISVIMEEKRSDVTRSVD